MENLSFWGEKACFYLCWNYFISDVNESVGFSGCAYFCQQKESLVCHGKGNLSQNPCPIVERAGWWTWSIVETCFNKRVLLMQGGISSSSWMQEVYMLLMVWVRVFSFLAEKLTFWHFLSKFFHQLHLTSLHVCLGHDKMQRMSSWSQGNQWKHPVASKDTGVSLILTSVSSTK